MPKLLDLHGKRFGRLMATNHISSHLAGPKRLCYCGCIRRKPRGYAARNVVLKRYKKHAKGTMKFTDFRSWAMRIAKVVDTW
jgi:hypothetical protein